MKKYFLISLLALVFVTNFYGEKIFSFEEINKPNALIISDKSLFISEATSLLIYSMDDFKLINKFGKEGEGPMEFKKNHMGEGIKFTINSKRICINSETKLSLFDLKGKFLKEYRVVPMMNLIPVEKNYISRGLSKSDGYYPKIAISLFDSKFKKKKDLFISNVDSGMGAKIPTPMYNYNYKFYKGKVYLSTGTDRIKIDVYDTNGNEEHSIIKDMGKKSLSQDYISRVKNHYRTDPRTKNFWEYFKKNLSFLSHFPGLRSFEIDNSRVYVQTYKMKEGKSEWIIFGLKGKEIGRVWLPSIEISAIKTAPYTIFNGSLYWMIENDEDESWELHRYKITNL